MFKYIATLAIKFRLIILLILGASTVFMLYQGRKVSMSYKLAQLLPKSDQAFIDYENFKNKYGQDGSMVIIAVKSKDFWKKEKFDQFLAFNNNIKSLEGIENVASLKNAVILHKDDSLMQFVPVNLISKESLSAKQIDSIRIELYKQPLYNKLLYNSSENTYLVLATLDKEVLNSPKRIALVEQMEKIIEQYSVEAGVETHISGLPYIRTVNVKMGQKEISLFIGLAALVTAIVLILIFRSFWEVVVPLAMVGVAVIWAQGTIGLMGYQITILTGLVPPLLIVIGVPNSIYIINKYHREIALHNGDKTKALIHVIDRAGSAVFMANLTTAIGFGTFIFTNSEILKEFGYVASLNVLLLFMLSVLLIPILFSYLPAPSIKSRAHLDKKFSHALVRIFILLSQYYRKYVFMGAAAVLIFALYGITKIEVKGSIVDDMPEGNKALADLRFFEKVYGGVMPLEILIDTKREKAVVRDQKLWKKIDEFQEYVNNQTIYSRPLSIVELYKTANQAFYNGDPSAFEVPSRLDAPFIIDYVKGDTGQDSLLNSMTDSSKSVARISIQMKNLTTLEVAEAKKDLEEKLYEIFDKEVYDITITGASISYMYGTNYLIKNLFQSLFLAVILIALFMGILLKNVRIVIMSLVPNIIPALLTAGLMGYFGIPIKPSTVLVFSIAFGISVDDTIHFLTRFKQELKAYKGNIRSAVVKAIRETTMSMVYTSVVLFFGFSVFSASNFGGTKALGMLVSLTLLSAMITNLVLLPSLLMIMYKIQNKKNNQANQQQP